MAELSLKSSAFSNNDPIPIQYTGEGSDMSPPLEWSDVPEGTQELALICEDPDAPQKEPFTHWLLYNLPPTIGGLPEGISSEANLVEPVKASQGRNSFGQIGYNGPLPPVGHGVHHYVFKLFALHSKLNIKAGTDRDRLLRGIQKHKLRQASLVGTYERKAAKEAA